MRVLITGNAGFIGQVAWTTFQSLGWDVYGLDDLSRRTSRKQDDPNALTGDVGKIRQIPALDIDFDFVLHLAGQVSVVAGQKDPDRDFHSNAFGTYEVVQWARERNAGVVYASSNKVFGELQGLKTPVTEDCPIQPQTNYGVSKACGALYVQDYGRGWVLHQSCIYGSSQLGEVDQGWVGWLRHNIANRESVTCFGDGTQVRDLLHVNDLVDLYVRILQGQIPPDTYVVGGGISNAVTFAEAVSLLGGHIEAFADWRPHDQRYFVSANSSLSNLGWTPRVAARDWLQQAAIKVGD